MLLSQDLYADALTFAARAHGKQITPFGLPYVVHVSCVAMEVIVALHAEPGRDGDLAVTCALLHDVIEDTSITRNELESAFGPRVAAGVAALTKDISHGKTAAMLDSLDRIEREPVEVALVKLGDRITNLGPPPKHWTTEKIAGYRDEAILIADRLEWVSAVLGTRLRARIARYPME